MPARLPDQTLLLARTARILHENGQRSEATENTVRQLAHYWGLNIHIQLGWDEIKLYGEGMTTPIEVVAMPANINMTRVDAVLQAVAVLRAGRCDLPSFQAALNDAEQQPAAATPLFVLAATAGAVALALIFGAHLWQAILLIALSAAAGAVLRRWLGKRRMGTAGQAFAAALLAGVIGALAVRWQVSSALRLVAVCPCMILVPGPHILNGALDLLQQRITLGLARLTFAALTLLAIAVGVLLGLSLGGTDLPPLVGGRSISIWLDMVAAGVAAAAYCVYFSAPARMVGWAVLIGMAAHGARWLVISVFGGNVIAASWLACLVAGTLALILAHRRLPFTVVGFAAVVAMVPGVYVFRWVSALIELISAAPAQIPALQQAAAQDFYTALLITAAMVAGLLMPLLAAKALRLNTIH